MGRWKMGNGTRPKTTSQTKNHKDGKNHIMWLFRFCGRFVGATLAILHAVRFAHGIRIEKAYCPHAWLELAPESLRRPPMDARSLQADGNQNSRMRA